MRTVLIGHRGVGKTRLLERMKSYFTQATGGKTYFFDLDQEIEFREGKTVSAIFHERGEVAFRKLEIAVFSQLIQQADSFIISLGAGFNLQAVPEGIYKLWVRRKTDSLGRILLNRPRLNPELSPLDEYLKRLPLREESYRNHSDFEYIMPEGIEIFDAIEEKILKKDFSQLGGILTLLPKHFSNESTLQDMLRNFEVELFELRDDLLTLSQIQLASSLLPNRRILMSIRTAKPADWIQEFIRTGVQWDWATELGPCTGMASIYSIHQIPEAIFGSLDLLKKHIQNLKIPASAHIKLSPMIQNYKQLAVLWDWFSEDMHNRSILPRSQENGGWNWLRLYLKNRQKINFFRIDQGSAMDQPTLFEWMSVSQVVNNFAAVLGHPVYHSRTPIEQASYFAKRGMAVFAIDIQEDDFKNAMPFLEKLGLQAAAVTSPLKRAAFNFSPYRSALGTELGSVNTLVRKNQVWYSHNTDLDGFRYLFAQVTGSQDIVAVWGGGGTLPVIKKIVPQAWCFSASKSSLRHETDDQVPRSFEQKEYINLHGPEVLIWAASPDSQTPPETWRPKLVLDLNYREDSLAREYALQINAQYIDGLIMFKEQARAQRNYWERY